VYFVQFWVAIRDKKVVDIVFVETLPFSLVDLWLMFHYIKRFTTPKYDDAIYTDLLIQLMQLQLSSADNQIVPGSDDIMFQVMEQWVRFANTIKLRIAIRESNTTEIAAIYAEGSGFITDDVLVNQVT
jgi:hypothetical protein